MSNPDWLTLTAPSTGTLSVQPDAAPPVSDPCSLSSAGGYTRLKNLLYRVEVHGGTPRADYPTADGPRFDLAGVQIKLSRRNASVMARIEAVGGSALTGAEVSVAPAMLDPLNWFAPGLYAEIVSPHDDIDRRDALQAGGERLFRISRPTDSVVVLDGAALPRLTALAGQPNWFLRLWDAFPDGSGLVTAVAGGGQSQLIDLGDGLKARLGAGAAVTTFRRGDYWTFAARGDGSIDWQMAAPFEVPHGPLTQYAPLQVLNPVAAVPGDEDCRVPFAALTYRALLYRGGDGQAVPVPPGGGFAALPATLRVAVMRGRTPVVGAQVQWRNPASQVTGAGLVGDTSATDAEGVAEVTWSIDAAQPDARHQIEAVLLWDGIPEPQPVVFTAGFRTARQTSYQPEDSALLKDSHTVQDALTTLCKTIGTLALQTLQLKAITLKGANDDTELIPGDTGIIPNGLIVPHSAFDRAIVITTKAGPLSSKFLAFDLIVEVELDLPYPTAVDEKLFWQRSAVNNQGVPEVTWNFGTQRIRLDGKLEAAGNQLLWIASGDTASFLDAAPKHLFGQLADADIPSWKKDVQPLILCRLRIRSAHVWITDPRDDKRRIYLNAEHLGISAGQTERELLVVDRDPQRAADLEMFFYLAIKAG